MANTKRNKRNNQPESALENSNSVEKTAPALIERDLLLNILNSIGDGIYIINQQCDFEYVNQALETQFGAISGRKCYQYLNDREEVCPWCKNAAVFSEDKSVHWEWYSEKTGKTYDLLDTPLKNPDGSVSKLEVFRDITDRKLMEDALRESEELHRITLSSISDTVLITDDEGALTYICPNVHVIFGYSLQEVADAGHISFLLGDGHFDARDLDMMREIPNIERNITDKNGRHHALLVTVKRVDIKGGTILYTCRDVTERKRAEEELRKHQEFLTRVTDSVSEVILTVDIPNKLENRVITYVNKAVESVFGYKPEEFIDRNPEIQYANRGEFLKASRKLRDGIDRGDTTIKNELLLRRKTGEIFTAEVTVSLFRTEGRVTQFISTMRDISERKQMEEVLRESEQDLKRAQAVAHTGSWRLDVRHNQLLWSDETHRIFGIPKRTTMTYETFRSSIHPEDREYVDRKWAAALRGETYDIEHRIIVGDEVKWVRERATLEFDSQGLLEGGFGTVQDITERKLAEEAMQIKDIAFESAINAIVIADIEGRITYVNPSFVRMWGGVDEEEMLGRNILEFSTSKERALEIIESIKGSRAWVGEETVIRKDKSLVDIDLSASLVTDDTGKPVCIMCSMADITERKKLERLKDEFISLVSHELRTPLTVIKGCLNTLLTENSYLSYSEKRQLLNDAADETELLSHLIVNLLELSRAQAGQLILYPEALNLDVIASKVVKKMFSQYPTHSIKTDLPTHLPSVSADPLRLERIIYNLLENAVKYSPVGSEVRLFGRVDQDQLVIGITDQGAGISPSDKAKLFGPFQRLEQNVPSKVGGIGLGLMVCRTLIEAHGGRIWVESKPGRGSTFFFTMPLRGESRV
jgi:PAS domain S-box-containing protein